MKATRIMYLAVPMLILAAVVGLRHFSRQATSTEQVAGDVSGGPPGAGVGSGKGGELLIAFAGDLQGTLDPCG